MFLQKDTGQEIDAHISEVGLLHAWTVLTEQVKVGAPNFTIKKFLQFILILILFLALPWGNYDK